MTTSSATLDQRLAGAAQQLILAELSGSQPPSAAPRGLVQEQDAVDAMLLALTAVQEQVQAGRIAPDAATRLLALLMVVRDYLRPLPEAIAPDGTELLSADLAEMVEAVRLSLRR